MNNPNLLFPALLFILYVGAIIIGWIFISKTLKKYNQCLAEMRKNGRYTKWAKENKTLLFFAKLFNYAAIFCFASFIFISISKTSANVIILFELLFPFLFISIALHLILYLKLPKNQDEVL